MKGRKSTTFDLMRRFTALLLAPLYINAQIIITEAPETRLVGKVSSVGIYVAELNYSVPGTDTVYQLLYRNLKFKELLDVQSIFFSSRGNSADGLYQILRVAASSEGEKKFNIKLGEVSLVVAKNMEAIGKVADVFTEVGYFSLNLRQINKLFGKQNE